MKQDDFPKKMIEFYLAGSIAELEKSLCRTGECITFLRDYLGEITRSESPDSVDYQSGELVDSLVEIMHCLARVECALLLKRELFLNEKKQSN